MNLTPKQQQQMFYWLPVAMIIMFYVPLLNYISTLSYIEQKSDWLVVAILLSVPTIFLHQSIIALLTKLSTRNAQDQQNIRFAASLCYAHLSRSQYTLKLHSNLNNQIFSYEILTGMTPKTTRMRILFCLNAINACKGVVLSKELQAESQKEWDNLVPPYFSTEERKSLWKQEYAAARALSIKHKILIEEILAASKKYQNVSHIQAVVDKYPVVEENKT